MECLCDCRGTDWFEYWFAPEGLKPEKVCYRSRSSVLSYHADTQAEKKVADPKVRHPKTEGIENKIGKCAKVFDIKTSLGVYKSRA